jgi:hypothetical protein
MHVDAVFAFRRDDKLCSSADLAFYMLAMHIAFWEVLSIVGGAHAGVLAGATCALVRMSHMNLVEINRNGMKDSFARTSPIDLLPSACYS